MNSLVNWSLFFSVSLFDCIFNFPSERLIVKSFLLCPATSMVMVVLFSDSFILC